MTKTETALLCLLCALISFMIGIVGGGKATDRLITRDCENIGHFTTKNKSFKCEEVK